MMSHEVSVTFPMMTKSGTKVWVNAASVNPDDPEGPRFSEDQVRDRITSGAQKAHSVSKTVKEAESLAVARSAQGTKAPAAAILIGDIISSSKSVQQW